MFSYSPAIRINNIGEIDTLASLVITYVIEIIHIRFINFSYTPSDS